MTVSTIHSVSVVDAPTPERRTGGLLDVAEVREGVAWIAPEDMFVSWNCIESHETTVCLPDNTPAKTFDGPTVVDGTQFVGYLGGECKPLGFQVEENISRVFDLRESRLVEKRFEATVLGGGTLISGTPTSAAHALGMMENALGDQYAGVGTIHMGPLVATLLLADQLLVEEGGKFYTRLGTKVVVGTGYASLAMYGTGDVTVYRSAKEVHPAPDTANNVQRVLAERVYVVVADCVSLRMSGIPASGSVTASPAAPVSGTPHAQELVGPMTWTIPPNTTQLSVQVEAGSVEANGQTFTAPFSASWDMDGGFLTSATTLSLADPADRALVTWVTVP